MFWEKINEERYTALGIGITYNIKRIEGFWLAEIDNISYQDFLVQGTFAWCKEKCEEYDRIRAETGYKKDVYLDQLGPNRCKFSINSIEDPSKNGRYIVSAIFGHNVQCTSLDTNKTILIMSYWPNSKCNNTIISDVEFLTLIAFNKWEKNNERFTKFDSRQ